MRFFRCWIVLVRVGLLCGAAGLQMHLWNRDTLKERIKVITAEAKTTLNSAQSRLEQVQRQADTDRQSFQVEVTEAQRVTKQITVERDNLLAKIQQLSHVNQREIVNWEAHYRNNWY